VTGQKDHAAMLDIKADICKCATAAWIDFAYPIKLNHG
jgi:hypothetical protein